MTANPLQSIQTPDLLQERLTRLKADMPDLFTNEGQLSINELLRLAGQQGREHFDFQWWGKSAAKRNAFTPTTAALRYDESPVRFVSEKHPATPFQDLLQQPWMEEVLKEETFKGQFVDWLKSKFKTSFKATAQTETEK